MKFTFIVSTTADRGKTTKFNSEINSHVAANMHAELRWLRRLRAEAQNKCQQQHKVSKRPVKLARWSSDRVIQELHSKADLADTLDSEESSTSDPTDMQLRDSSMDRALVTILDPFLPLPVTLSSQDKTSLQFYLVDARCGAMSSTSLEPLARLASEAAIRYLRYSPMFVHTRICISEVVLCRMKGASSMSARFYDSQANAYRAMNKLLSDRDTTFYTTLCNFSMIITYEFVLGRLELVAKHVRAMNQYTELKGGLSVLLAQAKSNRRQQAFVDLAPYIGLGNFLWAEVPFETEQSFTATLTCFMRLMTRIRTWVQSQKSISCASRMPGQRLSSSHHRNSCAHTTSASSAPILREYLDCLISEFLQASKPHFSQIAGTFHFIFGLCASQAVYNYDTNQSIEFIELVNRYLTGTECNDRASWKNASSRMSMIVTTLLLSSVRSQVWTPSVVSEACGKEKEIELCQAGVVMLRLLPLLSWSTRLRLARDFQRCALAAIDGSSWDGVSACFGEDAFADLALELHDAWLTVSNQCLRRHQVRKICVFSS